uniref:Uncharacterized protein n=1 Tax=Panagrolaimus sp. JU765 TaxID=591449 RepID=A0AC34QK71_9BILA
MKRDFEFRQVTPNKMRPGIPRKGQDDCFPKPRPSKQENGNPKEQLPTGSRFKAAPKLRPDFTSSFPNLKYTKPSPFDKIKKIFVVSFLLSFIKFTKLQSNRKTVEVDTEQEMQRSFSEVFQVPPAERPETIEIGKVEDSNDIQDHSAVLLTAKSKADSTVDRSYNETVKEEKSIHDFRLKLEMKAMVTEFDCKLKELEVNSTRMELAMKSEVETYKARVRCLESSLAQELDHNQLLMNELESLKSQMQRMKQSNVLDFENYIDFGKVMKSPTFIFIVVILFIIRMFFW